MNVWKNSRKEITYGPVRFRFVSPLLASGGCLRLRALFLARAKNIKLFQKFLMKPQFGYLWNVRPSNLKWSRKNTTRKVNMHDLNGHFWCKYLECKQDCWEYIFTIGFEKLTLPNYMYVLRHEMDIFLNEDQFFLFARKTEKRYRPNSGHMYF